MSSGLVLKRWHVKGEPKPPEEPIIAIEGRQPGLIAFFLNLIGLDPTEKLEVTSTAIHFSRSSLSGQQTFVVPLTKVSSTYYGYHKPIQLLIAAVVSAPTIIGPIIFGILYFLSKSLTVAVIEQSGQVLAIQFKSSVIEGVKIDQDECAKVSGVIRDLLIQNG